MEDQEIVKAIREDWKKAALQPVGLTNGELVFQAETLRISTRKPSDNFLAELNGFDQLKRVLQLLYPNDANDRIRIAKQGLRDHLDSESIYILPSH